MAKIKSAGNLHPSLDITSTDGAELAGRKIVLCVAGSVAAYRSIELARLLMRRGANVTCVASGAVTRLLRPDYLKWATGNDVITKLTGSLEHIRIAEKNTSDMVIVYPCTANTLGKLANGIDDGPVSTVLTVALGAGIPMLVCPAMHASMYENAAVKRNISFLKSKKVKFSLPGMREGKAKLAEPADVLSQTMKTLGASGGPLSGKRALVTVGGTSEEVDAVRSITNQSSGRMGTALVSELLRAGARVSAVYGHSVHEPPKGAAITRVKSSAQMSSAVKSHLRAKKFDLIVMAAAVSDYIPEKRVRGKIPSGKKSLVIRLERAPKIIDNIKKIQNGAFLVGFKAEAGVSKAALKRSANAKLAECGANMIVANDVGTARYAKNPGSNEVLIVDGKTAVASGYKSKERLATFIVKEIAKKI